MDILTHMSVIIVIVKSEVPRAAHIGLKWDRIQVSVYISSIGWHYIYCSTDQE